MERVALIASPSRLAKKTKASYYYKDIGLDDVVDNLDSQQQIKKQIASIENEIENIGKVCDKRKIESEKAYQQSIDEERKELDAKIIESLNRLEELLNQYKIAKETDYKSIYKGISVKLKKISKEIEQKSKILIKHQEKKKILDEENVFYSEQLDYAKDMNMYLKHKIQSMLVAAKKNENVNTSSGEIATTNSNNIATNQSTSPVSIKIASRNKKAKNNSRYYSPTSNGGLLITTLSSSKNIKRQIQTENNLSIEDVKKQFDFAENKIQSMIKQINKEINKKKKTYDIVKSATSNVYQSTMRAIINEMKVNLPKVNSLKGNSYMSNRTNNMSDSGCSGKMNKMDKKEIVIQFLENRQVKNMIYGFLYN